jgi:hypothetical protein
MIFNKESESTLVSQSVTTMPTILATAVSTTARPTPRAPPEALKPLNVQISASVKAKTAHLNKPLKIDQPETIVGT